MGLARPLGPDQREAAVGPLPPAVERGEGLLAVLGIAKGGDYHRLNAMKNFIGVLIATVAIVVFVGGGVVAWLPAAVMIPGGALGGYAGVWMAKRVPQWVVRALVIIVGLLLSWYYFTK